MRFRSQKGQTTIILLVVVFIFAFLLIGGLGDPTHHTILSPDDPNQLKAQQENGGLLGRFENMLGLGIGGTQIPTPTLTPTPPLAPGATIAPSPTPTGTTEYPPRPIKFFWDEPSGSYTNPQVNGSNSQGSSLQMKNLNFSSAPVEPPTVIPLTPAPHAPLQCGTNPVMLGTDANGNCCVQDGAVDDPSQCCPGVWYCKTTGIGLEGHVDPQKNICDIGGGAYWCDAKPIIYLYPEKKTNVSVFIKVPGSIISSIPLYPVGGWKNIIAYPGGSFVYNGKIYKELFYEASVTPIDPPRTGFIIAASDLRKKLLDLTTQLGLTSSERSEFISYWAPRLEDLQKPYIFVSLFDPNAKNTIDQVEITPKPDTFIQYIFYFKPLEKPIRVEPLKLPFVPQRNGFTAVEWGGIID